MHSELSCPEFKILTCGRIEPSLSSLCLANFWALYQLVQGGKSQYDLPPAPCEKPDVQVHINE